MRFTSAAKDSPEWKTTISLDAIKVAYQLPHNFSMNSFLLISATESENTNGGVLEEQGRIHGNPVADGWAGAVMQKPVAIQKCYGPTDRHGKV